MISPGPIAALETSPWGQILNEICETIVDLDLTGIDGNVWVRDPPTLKATGNSLIPLPAVIISPFSPSHTPSDGPMTVPRIWYRAMVGIVATADAAVNATLADRLKWYDLVFAAFAKRSAPFDLDGAASTRKLIRVVVEPGDPAIIEAWKLNFDAAWIAVACEVEYPSTAA